MKKSFEPEIQKIVFSIDTLFNAEDVFNGDPGLMIIIPVPFVNLNGFTDPLCRFIAN